MRELAGDGWQAFVLAVNDDSRLVACRLLRTVTWLWTSTWSADSSNNNRYTQQQLTTELSHLFTPSFNFLRHWSCVRRRNHLVTHDPSDSSQPELVRISEGKISAYHRSIELTSWIRRSLVMLVVFTRWFTEVKVNDMHGAAPLVLFCIENPAAASVWRQLYAAACVINTLITDVICVFNQTV